MSSTWQEMRKKARFARSFVQRRLVHVNLQLLYDCNLRCRICEFWKDNYRDKPTLSAAQVQVISDKLATIGPQIVSIGGGEPLMHPELEQIVGILAARHFPVMICNGWFVNPDKARALFQAGIYEVSVSVDYMDPAKHDAQRGVEGAHARALRALDTLNRARVHPWQRVHMISVIMDDNLPDVEPLIRKCRDMGITYLVTLYSDSRGRIDRRKPPADVSAHLLQLKERYPEFVVLRGYVGRFSEAIASGGIGPCECGRRLCNIDSQGDVSLCIDRLEDKVGNILRDDMSELGRRLLDKHGQNSCKACWTSCRGSIESVTSLGNLLDYHQMTRPVSTGN